MIPTLPYLSATMIAAFVLAAIAVVFRAQRAIAFFSGGLLAAATPMAMSYGDYWSPERLGGLPLGIADFLYAFSAGLMTWLLVAGFPFARRLVMRWRPGPIARRAAPVFGVVTFVQLGLLAAGMDSITATLVAMALAMAGVLAARPSLWPLALPAAISYPVLHCIAMALAFKLWPSLPSYWNQDLIWARPFLLEVPLGEFAYHAALGSAWPVMVAYFLDARPRGEDFLATKHPG